VTSLEIVRQEWEEGRRRFESARDEPARYGRLLSQLEVVSDELRKRVGQTYTLGDLALAYSDAERWARPLVEERAPSPGWPRDLGTVLAAAFHAYQRGAVDYLS
jgi:hypothetical protein